MAPVIRYAGSPDTLASEARLYLRIFLLVSIVQAFAMLRLYNSIVNNTRFLIKLRSVVKIMEEKIPELSRSLKNLRSTMTNSKGWTLSLKASIDSLTDAIKKKDA